MENAQPRPRATVWDWSCSFVSKQSREIFVAEIWCAVYCCSIVYVFVYQSSTLDAKLAQTSTLNCSLYGMFQVRDRIFDRLVSLSEPNYYSY